MTEPQQSRAARNEIKCSCRRQRVFVYCTIPSPTTACAPPKKDTPHAVQRRARSAQRRRCSHNEQSTPTQHDGVTSVPRSRTHRQARFARTPRGTLALPPVPGRWVSADCPRMSLQRRQSSYKGSAAAPPPLISTDSPRLPNAPCLTATAATDQSTTPPRTTPLVPAPHKLVVHSSGAWALRQARCPASRSAVPRGCRPATPSPTPRAAAGPGSGRDGSLYQ